MKPNDPFGPAIAALTARILSLQQLRQALEHLATERSACQIAQAIATTAASMIQDSKPKAGNRKAKPCIK